MGGLLPCLLLLSALSFMKANRFLNATEPIFIPRFAGCGQSAFESAAADAASCSTGQRPGFLPQQARLGGFLFTHCKNIFVPESISGPPLVGTLPAAAAADGGGTCEAAAGPVSPLQGKEDTKQSRTNLFIGMSFETA